jgi:precorrin isomerase
MSTSENSKRLPLIRGFLFSPMSPEKVEAASFQTIDSEAPHHEFTTQEWAVVQRMIHASADFGLVRDVRISPDSIRAAVCALRAGAPIYADSNMIRAGLSLARLRRVNPDYDERHIICHVADSDVVESAKREGMPRSIFAVRKARRSLDRGIALFGNAPLALLELNRLIIEDGIRPAFVAAMPVGFIHVVESKEELVSLDIPHIAISGRRGGSSLAVSTLHALCGIALKEEESDE